MKQFGEGQPVLYCLSSGIPVNIESGKRSD